MRFALALMILLAWACHQGDGTHLSDDHQAPHEAPGHAAADDGLELRLNDGAKCEMDEHTRFLFSRMAQRVGGYEGDQEAAKGLGGALEEDIDELIRGCKMTGDAHAELHKFLVALIPAVERVTASGGEEELGAVRELLDTYPRYFE